MGLRSKACALCTPALPAAAALPPCNPLLQRLQPYASLHLRYPRRPRLRVAAAASASDAVATVTAACAIGADSTSRSRPESPAIGVHAWRAPAAAHLDLDDRVLPDPPARERRFALEPLATVVQLKVVRREPGAVAEGLVQEGSRQVQRRRRS